jgi:hypothetical protein
MRVMILDENGDSAHNPTMSYIAIYRQLTFSETRLTQPFTLDCDECSIRSSPANYCKVFGLPTGILKQSRCSVL